MTNLMSHSYLFGEGVSRRTMIGITKKVVKEVRKTQNKAVLRFIGYDVDMCAVFETSEGGHEALTAIVTPYHVQVWRFGDAQGERNRPEIMRRRM